jgi:prepilin-type N-terminal cleavage/methylation domain-containing protein
MPGSGTLLKPRPRNKCGVTGGDGFSLVELSIVLVILGLLVGGILAGQSLIRAAELRSVSTDFSRFESSVFTFRDKYFALPGDMTNATAFWGIAGGTTGNDAACFDATSNGTTTCNGNGNGRIFHSDGVAENAPEWFHAWVQLKNAGLVEGSYTGRRASAGATREAVPGVNVPRSKISNGGFTLLTITFGNGDAGWYSGDYSPMLMFGTQAANLETYGNILKAEEAWNIDTKLDDGMPGLGRVRTFHNNANCVSSVAESDQNIATYNLTATAVACNLIYSLNNPGQ